ncbi:MAG: iron chaperone [Tepidiformaceae bacterium]
MDTSKGQFKTIDEYINTFPEEVKRVLQTLRETIREVAPQAQEKISYQIPTFSLHGNLVSFAAWKNHIGFYPASADMETAMKELSTYKTGKGTIQFPLDRPLPLPLIRKIVEFRVNENLERKAKKK